MRKIAFLAKLRKEGKLQLVEPSEAVKDSYMAKSESNLASAKILLQNNKLADFVSRLGSQGIEKYRRLFQELA